MLDHPIGLISPGLTGWYTWVSPLAATVFAGLLLCSIFFHLKYRQNPAIFKDVILLMLAIFLIYGVGLFHLYERYVKNNVFIDIDG
jgi:hypothetical protein